MRERRETLRRLCSNVTWTNFSNWLHHFVNLVRSNQNDERRKVYVNIFSMSIDIHFSKKCSNKRKKNIFTQLMIHSYVFLPFVVLWYVVDSLGDSNLESEKEREKKDEQIEKKDVFNWPDEIVREFSVDKRNYRYRHYRTAHASYRLMTYYPEKWIETKFEKNFDRSQLTNPSSDSSP